MYTIQIQTKQSNSKQTNTYGISLYNLIGGFQNFNTQINSFDY